jgi:hypothetical protein
MTSDPLYSSREIISLFVTDGSVMFEIATLVGLACNFFNILSSLEADPPNITMPIAMIVKNIFFIFINNLLYFVVLFFILSFIEGHLSY